MWCSGHRRPPLSLTCHNLSLIRSGMSGSAHSPGSKRCQSCPRTLAVGQCPVDVRPLHGRMATDPCQWKAPRRQWRWRVPAWTAKARVRIPGSISISVPVLCASFPVIPASFIAVLAARQCHCHVSAAERQTNTSHGPRSQITTGRSWGAEGRGGRGG